MFCLPTPDRCILTVSPSQPPSRAYGANLIFGPTHANYVYVPEHRGVNLADRIARMLTADQFLVSGQSSTGTYPAPITEEEGLRPGYGPPAYSVK